VGRAAQAAQQGRAALGRALLARANPARPSNASIDVTGFSSAVMPSYAAAQSVAPAREMIGAPAFAQARSASATTRTMRASVVSSHWC